MIKLFTLYKNSKCNTFEQCGLNPPPPFKYHLNFNCTFYPTSLFTLSLGIEPSYYVPTFKEGWMGGYLCSLPGIREDVEALSNAMGTKIC